MKYQTISLKQFLPAKGAIYYVAIATVIFSRVKIPCFRAKAHLVFHWCLYNKMRNQMFLKYKTLFSWREKRAQAS